MVAKLEYRDANDIIGIATESGVAHRRRSEDAIYFDAREWNAEMENDARVVREKLGILTKAKRFHDRAKEYPDVTAVGGRMKNPRNKPCPCGSGRKYKHCCLSK